MKAITDEMKTKNNILEHISYVIKKNNRHGKESHYKMKTVLHEREKLKKSLKKISCVTKKNNRFFFNI